MNKRRNSVFETNSSSSHVITINGELGTYTHHECYFPVVDYTGKIHIVLDNCEYGWGYERFNDQFEKLQYAIMMVIETEAVHCKNIDEIYQLEGFKTIQNIIPKEILLIDDGMHNENGYLYHAGYIDHQSHEDYSSLADFLKYYGITIEDFIYNEDIEVEITNDNQ